MSNYGLTLEAYETLLSAQGHRCAICRAEVSETGVLHGRNAHVDHEHATGQVRGILCRTCNVGIGHMRENPELLEVAAAYLRRARGED